MTDMSSGFIHPSGDPILTALSSVSGVMGIFIRNYPGRASLEFAEDWLKDWFQSRSTCHFLCPSPTCQIEPLSEDFSSKPLQQSNKQISKISRVESIRPHYFRGFRVLQEPIDLKDQLVLLEGRNSSGKTSLAEAFEWLLTGKLIRRSMQVLGNARELESCVGNQFRPVSEDTWVEAIFRTVNNDQVKMRRVLIVDYGSTQTSICNSTLYVNGVQIDAQEENHTIESFFAGPPPLLMQHTLRAFVQDNPAQRRNYFEKLLRLDELTYLIEKAVIGPVRLGDFKSPSGSVELRKWEELKTAVQGPTSLAKIHEAEDAKIDTLSSAIMTALTVIAPTEFINLIDDQTNIEDIKIILQAEQDEMRYQKFPLLDELRPKRTLDDAAMEILRSETLNKKSSNLRGSFDTATSAREAAKAITKSELAIAQAFTQLQHVGLVQENDESQICPLCNYEEVPTLTASRVTQVRSWGPIQQTVETANNNLETTKSELRTHVNAMRSARHGLIPPLTQNETWQKAIDGISETVANVANALRETQKEANSKLNSFDTAIESILKLLQQSPLEEKQIGLIEADSQTIASNLESLLAQSRIYLAQYNKLDSAVGTMAKKDPAYNLRDLWLRFALDPALIERDLIWERSKTAAQDELKQIRDTLMTVRQNLLESRRSNFSTMMCDIWQLLRADRYSSFAHLFIPEPRGKGFPIEIEVKVILDDGTQKREVDALCVFSESQVNVLGIAAFLTRCQLLGQKIVVLDDPVQSMDEEHFKTFASVLLPHLLEQEGFQVVLLTHNDTFARDVSFAHCDKIDFATMSIRHSRRKGCQVQEGNRRISERLQLADKRAEDGKLTEAWRLIRLAIERLYVLVYKKHGPSSFDPMSWIDQTAEYMWNNGVGEIIEQLVPSSGNRLKDILNLTVAGAHDKTPRGTTDIFIATEDIRRALSSLQVGN